jgi:hypothetical protein
MSGGSGYHPPNEPQSSRGMVFREAQVPHCHRREGAPKNCECDTRKHWSVMQGKQPVIEQKEATSKSYQDCPHYPPDKRCVRKGSNMPQQTTSVFASDVTEGELHVRPESWDPLLIVSACGTAGGGHAQERHDSDAGNSRTTSLPGRR